MSDLVEPTPPMEPPDLGADENCDVPVFLGRRFPEDGALPLLGGGGGGGLAWLLDVAADDVPFCLSGENCWLKKSADIMM